MNHRPHGSILFATALVVVALVPQAQAGGYVVTTLADGGAGSLRQAIADANSNAGDDQIVFANGLSGTLELASALDAVTEGLSITGPGPTLLTVDANGHGRVLELAGAAGESFQVTGLTLTGGATSGSDTGGGIWLADGQTLTMEDVHLVGNRAGLPGALRKGGGLFASSGSTITIRSSLVADNSANQGGGICSYGDLTVEQSAIVDNSARLQGGGVWVFGGTATVTETTVARNVATGDGPTISFGGGIYVTSGGVLTLYHATVTTNWASSGPGIRLFDSGVASTVAGTIIAGNRLGAALLQQRGLTVDEGRWRDRAQVT